MWSYTLHRDYSKVIKQYLFLNCNFGVPVSIAFVVTFAAFFVSRHPFRVITVQLSDFYHPFFHQEMNLVSVYFFQMDSPELR